MKEGGFYYPNGTYRDRNQIRRKLLMEELGMTPGIINRSAQPKKRDFQEWTDVITRQQRERKEVLEIPEFIEVEIATFKPILVALIGDVHAGGEDVDYDRFSKDVNLIKEAGGYTIAVGDLTDSYFFMPGVGHQIMAGDEQVLYMQSALDLLAEDNKLIAAFGGDHDMWPSDKGGAHTLYAGFHDRFNAHYLEGVSYIDLKLVDGESEVDYGFVGSHRHKGFSVYNDAHASLRQFRDEGVGAMVSFTAHNHVKAQLRQTHKLHTGNEVVVNCLALGSYKESDRYSRKMGWPRKKEESLGAFGLILYPGEKKMETFWTISEAVDKISQLT